MAQLVRLPYPKDRWQRVACLRAIIEKTAQTGDCMQLSRDEADTLYDLLRSIAIEPSPNCLSVKELREATEWKQKGLRAVQAIAYSGNGS